MVTLGQHVTDTHIGQKAEMVGEIEPWKLRHRVGCPQRNIDGCGVDNQAST